MSRFRSVRGGGGSRRRRLRQTPGDNVAEQCDQIVEVAGPIGQDHCRHVPQHDPRIDARQHEIRDTIAAIRLIWFQIPIQREADSRTEAEPASDQGAAVFTRTASLNREDKCWMGAKSERDRLGNEIAKLSLEPSGG